MARKTLDEIFKSVMTSELIIKRKDMPEFKIKEMRQNIARFGKETIEKWIDYQFRLNNIRLSTKKLTEKTFANIPAIV